MTTGQQRAYRDLAKKRVKLDTLYQDTPRFLEPSRQGIRATGRMAAKEYLQMKKHHERGEKQILRSQRRQEKNVKNGEALSAVF